MLSLVFRCTAQRFSAFSCAALYFAARCCSARNFDTLCSVLLTCAVLHSSVMLSAALFYAPLFIAVLRCIAFRFGTLIYAGLCIFAAFHCAAVCHGAALGYA